jgi:hypothetical protein
VSYDSCQCSSGGTGIRKPGAEGILLQRIRANLPSQAESASRMERRRPLPILSGAQPATSGTRTPEMLETQLLPRSSPPRCSSCCSLLLLGVCCPARYTLRRGLRFRGLATIRLGPTRLCASAGPRASKAQQPIIRCDGSGEGVPVGLLFGMPCDIARPLHSEGLSALGRPCIESNGVEDAIELAVCRWPKGTRKAATLIRVQQPGPTPDGVGYGKV